MPLNRQRSFAGSRDFCRLQTSTHKKIVLPSPLFQSILYIGVTMSEIDLAPLIPAIRSYIPLGRSGLLPALHAAQKIYGWVSEPVAAEISKSLHVPLADVHGVIEF